MKTKKVNCKIGYSDSKNDFALIWKVISDYLETYDFFVDKIIWVFEIEESDVSIFPGSPEDADDPDIPLAFQFHIPDLWDGEPEELSEDDKAFKKAYNKRKKWLMTAIKQSFTKFPGRKKLVQQGIDGKLGIYLAEFFERLMPPALTFVCGTKIDFSKGSSGSPDDLVDQFCQKYDLNRFYAFPRSLDKLDEIYLTFGEIGRAGFPKELSQLISALPGVKAVNIAANLANNFGPESRKVVSKNSKVKFRELSIDEQINYHESVELGNY